jgi:hypothetical protein
MVEGEQEKKKRITRELKEAAHRMARAWAEARGALDAEGQLLPEFEEEFKEQERKSYDALLRLYKKEYPDIAALLDD